MSTSLYQKYRPKSFAELVGQDHIKDTLLNELKNGTAAHAYLFSGPRGIGKTTSARLLARAINCTDLQDGEPDNSCNNCSTILEGKALDIIEIDAASHTGVDNVRENIIDNARVAPSLLPWKVFIIDEVHMLSTSAFNALLKTLEEPPANTMFILATTEIHKVPATIISRCERYTFKKIGPDHMSKRLTELAAAENIKVDSEVIEAITKKSEGALRDGESLLGQVLALDDSHITVEIAEIVLPQSDTSEIIGLWEELVRGQVAPAIARINRLTDEGVILSEFIKNSVEFLRKILIYRVQDSLMALQYLDLTKEDVAKIANLTKQVEADRLAEIVEIFMDAQEKQQTATIPQLPLELAIVKITSLPGTKSSNQDDPKNPDAPEPDTDDAEKLDAGNTSKDEASAQTGTDNSSGTVTNSPVESAAPIEPTIKSEDGIAKVEASFTSKEVTSETEIVIETELEKDKSWTQREVGDPETSRIVESSAQTVSESESAEAPVVSGSAGATEDTIKNNWPELLQELKEQNHALHLTFKVGRLVSFKTGLLTMGFEYKFYQDRLNDAHNLPVIETAFEKIFGEKMRLETIIGPEYGMEEKSQDANIEQPSEAEVSNVWDLAASSFDAS